MIKTPGRYIFFIVVFAAIFCQHLPVLSQNIFLIHAYKDSLKGIPEDVDKIYFLNRIGFEFKTAFPDSTIFYCTKAEERAKIIEYAIGNVLSLNYQAIANVSIGHIELALTQHENAISISIARKDSILLAQSKNYLGRLYLETGNLADAFENFAQARLIFEHYKNQAGMSEVYLSLSDLFKSQHDYSNGLEMASQAISLKKQLGDVNGVIASLSVLAEIYRLTGDFAQAETSYREAESLASDIEDEADLAIVKLGLGELYLESGSLSKAESEAFRADNIITRLSNPSFLSRSTLLLGRIFLKKKNFQQAETYFLKTLEVSSRLRQLTTYMEVNFYLARLHELTGRDESAARFESQYRLLNDSIRNNELALEAEKFNFQLDIERRDQENELLKATEQKNEATIKFQKTVNFGAMLVIGLILFFSYFLWQSSKARKRVNKKLSVQNQQLVTMNEEKDALMGIVAHDLKTPFSNIKSILELLPEFGSLTSKQLEFTNLINTSSLQGLDLIDELLDAHELEAQRKANLKLIEIESVLHERIEHFRPIASSKGITLTIDAKSKITLKTDADWLSRILDNLISNAIKFSQRESEVKVSTGTNDNQLWIAIKDQGPGFSEEDKSKVFQKFKKLSARPTGGETSNGLGLSIVKTLVERLNGTIALLSNKGHGSEFIIRLPIVE